MFTKLIFENEFINQIHQVGVLSAKKPTFMLTLNGPFAFGIELVTIKVKGKKCYSLQMFSERSPCYEAPFFDLTQLPVLLGVGIVRREKTLYSKPVSINPEIGKVSKVVIYSSLSFFYSDDVKFIVEGERGTQYFIYREQSSFLEEVNPLV